MGLVSDSSSSCSNSPSALSHLKMHIVVSMLVGCLLSAVSLCRCREKQAAGL